MKRQSVRVQHLQQMIESTAIALSDQIKEVKMLEINWWGKDHPTTLPSTFTGAIIFRLRGVGAVIGFKLPFELKEEIKAFVKERGGNWDNTTKTWWVKAGKSHEIGECLKAFRVEFDGAIPSFSLAVDPEMGESVIAGFEAYVNK